jgi:hypothetical protein
MCVVRARARARARVRVRVRVRVFVCVCVCVDTGFHCKGPWREQMQELQMKHCREWRPMY